MSPSDRVGQPHRGEVGLGSRKSIRHFTAICKDFRTKISTPLPVRYPGLGESEFRCHPVTYPFGHTAVELSPRPAVRCLGQELTGMSDEVGVPFGREREGVGVGFLTLVAPPGSLGRQGSIGRECRPSVLDAVRRARHPAAPGAPPAEYHAVRARIRWPPVVGTAAVEMIFESVDETLLHERVRYFYGHVTVG